MPSLKQSRRPARLISEVARLAVLYPASLVLGLKDRLHFRDLQTFVLFVGSSRSGHSFVGSLLDAHPNIVMAHEMGVLKFVRAGYVRSQVCTLLRRNSIAFTTAGRESKRYNYQVPNQWQGRSSRILVLGDNMAEGATRRLRQKPGLLRRLETAMGVPVKLIQVVRNPFDSISTIALRTRKKQLESDLNQSAEFYFSLCETVKGIRNEADSDNLFELRHETLINSSREHLTRLCGFLGLEATSNYLDDCTSIIYPSPHRSRHEARWTPELIEQVKDRMASFDFLRGYSFEDRGPTA